MKALEEKNMTYMHNTVSLEDELRKANAARAQLETYKRQVTVYIIYAFIIHSSAKVQVASCLLYVLTI